MSVTIGIDPATACGWAMLDADGNRLGSGVWDLRTKRHEGAGMRYVRLRRYLADLLNLADNHGSRVVVYEEVRRHAGTSAAHIYGGIVSQLQEVCELANVPYGGIPVGTVKKHATGKGNAGKPAMIAAANERWRLDLTDDNEADALWIADTWRTQ